MRMHEKKVEGISWNQSIADRVHLINGGWPIPYFRIPMNKLLEITKDCKRISITGMDGSGTSGVFLKKILPGGIRMPHLHLKDEVVLFDKHALQQYFHLAADEVSNIEDITEIRDFIKF